jgi:hypothetical protein
VRKRPLLFATLAVVLIGVAGATTVFFVGSKQRRDDGRAYLAYERAVLERIGQLDPIVSPAANSYLGELRAGRMSVPEALGRASNWDRALVRVRADLVALAPPAFLNGLEVRWASSIDAYVRVVGLFAQAARAAGATRNSSLDAAEDALRSAGERLNGAARLMQFHRRRLGLGATANLPDPATRNE